MRPPHEILGIPRDADEALIRRAYRALARRYHPDASGSEHTGTRFAEISDAYERMLKGDRRTNHAHPSPPARPEPVWEDEEDDPGEVYDAFFASSAPKRDTRPAPYARRAGTLDLEITLPLTLAESQSGGVFDVPSPLGPVAVRIEPGTPVGGEVHVPGAGALGRGMYRGDLIVIVGRIEGSGDGLTDTLG